MAHFFLFFFALTPTHSLLPLVIISVTAIGGGATVGTERTGPILIDVDKINIDNHTTDLIVRYLGGMLDDDEMRELTDWASLSEANARYLHRQCELWVSAGASGELDRFDTDAAYRRFERSVEAERAADADTDIDTDTDGGVRPRWRMRIASVAAAVAVVAVLAGGAFWMGRQNLKDQLAEMTVTAPDGSNSEVVLPDGTHVWLNSGTTLSYSQGYGVDERDVRIKGEGYFEVKRNQELPFTVSSEDMKVRVLGTKFNYSDYTGGDKATVTLAEGRVAMRGNRPEGGEYVLAPGQRAVLDKHTGRIVIENCKAADDIAWTSGTISFEGQTLYEIAATLSKIYDMDVRVATVRAGRKRFYGDFSRRGQSAADIVRDLCRTSDISYTMSGRSITIR